MKSVLDVMADKVLIGDDCWEWIGFRNQKGYGIVNRDGKMRKAHRVIYEFFEGEVGQGQELDHLCRNHACVRPDHLESVDHGKNVRRGNAHAGINSRKTHCVRGHEFTEANTILRSDGRECRICKNSWNRANNWKYR